MYLILENDSGECRWTPDPECTFSILMYATKQQANKAMRGLQQNEPTKEYRVRRLPSYALSTSIKKS